jgi:orotidine-5'-phosphate decarboxylase
MTFYDKLNTAWQKNNSLLCVGLDPEVSKFPKHIQKLDNCIFEFNKQIIDATAEFACSFKPQFAHYAAVGAEDQLQQTIAYIKKNYPDLIVILDSKRGDIGSTAKMYAQESFERYSADAVTVNPYLGKDSLDPFLEYKDKGTIVLCRTSNASAKDFQDIKADGKTVYEKVAEEAVSSWNYNQNVLLVIGATYPEELGKIRKIAPQIPFLVPGIGAQGGDVQAVLKAGLDTNKCGLLINSSRGIIYASNGEDFADVARSEAKKLCEQINQFRN